jgi:hypothetical protein
MEQLHLSMRDLIKLRKAIHRAEEAPHRSADGSKGKRKAKGKRPEEIDDEFVADSDVDSYEEEDGPAMGGNEAVLAYMHT